MTKNYVIHGSWILVSGDTFSIREQLKAMGARWRAADKTWVLDHLPEKQEGLQKLGFFLKPTADSSSPNPGLNPSLNPGLNPSLNPGLTSALPPEKSTSDALERTFSVGEINALLGASIQSAVPHAFWLQGEVTSLKLSKGHCYFDISDPTSDNRPLKASSLSCCLWSGRRKILEDKHGELSLADGLKVRIYARAEWRAEGGRVSCIVEDVDADHTEGALARSRKAIVLELKKRGLFDANKRTYLTDFALRIALVSADGSRALSDFVNELSLSQLAYRIVLYDCHMQGNNTSPELTQALTHIAQNSNEYDVVVVTRGGGSRLDLRWFDDLEIGKAIGKCPLPVVCAIGHFEDVSIADEVCFLSLKTPTAAAAYFSTRIQKNYADIANSIESKAQQASKRLSRLRGLLQVWSESLAKNAQRRLQNERNQIQEKESQLNLTRRQTMAPLTRGYVKMIKQSETNAEDNSQIELHQILSPSAFVSGAPDKLDLQMWDRHSSQHILATVKVISVKIWKDQT